MSELGLRTGVFGVGIVSAHAWLRSTRTERVRKREIVMLYWAAMFFVLAIVAAVFGFGGIAAGAVGIGKILFVGFLILAVVSLIAGRKLPAGG